MHILGAAHGDWGAVQYFFETSPYLTLVPSCPILSPYFSLPGCSSASSCALLQNVPWLKGVVPSTAYDFHHRDPNFARACEELAMGKLLGSFECLKNLDHFCFWVSDCEVSW